MCSCCCRCSCYPFPFLVRSTNTKKAHLLSFPFLSLFTQSKHKCDVLICIHDALILALTSSPNSIARSTKPTQRPPSNRPIQLRIAQRHGFRYWILREGRWWMRGGWSRLARWCRGIRSRKRVRARCCCRRRRWRERWLGSMCWGCGVSWVLG